MRGDQTIVQDQAEQQQQDQHVLPAMELTPLVREHALGASGLPSAVSVISGFITAEEERQLLRDGSRTRWTQLSGRRLQSHGGSVHATKGLLQTPLPGWLAPVLARMHERTGAFGAAPANHVLINAYQPGEGIMPHEDGPLYHPGVCILSLAHPVVIHFWRKPTSGQGSPDVDSAPEASVLLMPRSLLVFHGEAYTHCLHGIRQVQEEQLRHPDSGAPAVLNLERAAAASRDGGDATTAEVLSTATRLPRAGERISLTVRRVLKVTNAARFIKLTPT